MEVNGLTKIGYHTIHAEDLHAIYRKLAIEISTITKERRLFNSLTYMYLYYALGTFTDIHMKQS